MKRVDKIMGGWFPKIIRDPALWITLIVSLAIAFAGDEEVLRSVRVDVGVAQVQIGTALLGIVLAGLAILVVFLDEKYIALLEKVPPGFDADLWTFKFTALVAIICATFGMVLIILGMPQVLVFRIVFWLSLWSFSYLLWVVFDLVKFIAGHAKARMKQIQKNKHQE
jgi:hypothetical protein